MWLRLGPFQRKHNVSRRTVTEWIRLGKVTSKRIGHTRFVWDGLGDPEETLARMEKKIDDIHHAILTRKESQH